jgi:hypothetical protein
MFNFTVEATISVVMEEEIRRWNASRKSALVVELIQGKTTVAETSRQFESDALCNGLGPETVWS